MSSFSMQIILQLLNLQCMNNTPFGTHYLNVTLINYILGSTAVTNKKNLKRFN